MKLGVVAQAYNPSIWKVETGVQGLAIGDLVSKH